MRAWRKTLAGASVALIGGAAACSSGGLEPSQTVMAGAGGEVSGGSAGVGGPAGTSGGGASAGRSGLGGAHAGGAAGTAGGGGAGMALGDGFHSMTVRHPDGSTDDVWLYAISPDRPGPLPVVVYARGQGSGDFVNCKPGSAQEAFWSTTGAEADLLSAPGYLAVAVEYRNTGSGAPGVGSAKLRDHGLRDARAVLAAAQWARSHVRGSAQVAFVGASMGVWPVSLIVGNDPALEEPRGGLTIETVVFAGESGNHVANSANEDILSSNLDQRIPATAGVVLSTVAAHVAALDLAVVRAEDLDQGPLGSALRQSLTQRGVDLARILAFEEADLSLPGCAHLAGKPPVCDRELCVPEVMAAHVVGSGAFGRTEDWMTPEAIAAVTYWNPPAAVDPGPSPTSPLLAILHQRSPAYVLEGPIATDRALSLLSRADSHYSTDARSQLIGRLTPWGTTVEAPDITDDVCRHGDYVAETKMRGDGSTITVEHCGIRLIHDELAAAFAD